jgi:hypothetical protein
MKNERHHEVPSRPRLHAHAASLQPRVLLVCSICLRVLWDGTWSDSRMLTRVFRTPERASTVHLLDGLCDRCMAERHLPSSAPLAA